MSVPSELIGNTQNSFQTHAQRGANIVMRGGKKNRRTRKKRGSGGNKKVTIDGVEYLEESRTGSLYKYPEEWEIRQKLRCLDNELSGYLGIDYENVKSKLTELTKKGQI